MFELRLDDTHLQMAIEFEVEDAVAGTQGPAAAGKEGER